MSYNIKISPYFCPCCSVLAVFFQTLLILDIHPGMTVHHTLMIVFIINEKDFIMQYAKFQIYTLKLDTFFWHYKNAITFEQECMCACDTLQWRHMSVMASRITGSSTVCLTICSQLCITGPFEGNPLVDSAHKKPVMWKSFPQMSWRHDIFRSVKMRASVLLIFACVMSLACDAYKILLRDEASILPSQRTSHSSPSFMRVLPRRGKRRMLHHAPEPYRRAKSFNAQLSDWLRRYYWYSKFRWTIVL